MLSIAQSQRLACRSWCPRRTVRHPQDLLVRRCLEGLEAAGHRSPQFSGGWCCLPGGSVWCLIKRRRDGPSEATELLAQSGCQASVPDVPRPQPYSRGFLL